MSWLPQNNWQITGICWFMFIGDGAGRKELVKEAEQSGLSTVLFLTFQPRARLPEVLASADISLYHIEAWHGNGFSAF
jgi:hypothetical protein